MEDLKCCVESVDTPAPKVTLDIEIYDADNEEYCYEDVTVSPCSNPNILIINCDDHMEMWNLDYIRRYTVKHNKEQK